MAKSSYAATCLVFLAIVGFAVSPLSASLIDTGTPYGGWSGTTSFTGISNPHLTGTIDWAVFGPDGFPFSGYSPTAGELTYVYQIHCTGTSEISTLIVPWPSANTADNGGSFDDPAHGVTGVPAVSTTLIPDDSIVWKFVDGTHPGINTGISSVGLAYSSPNVPQAAYGIIINGGTVAVVDPIPAPSTTPIPEPASLWLLITAALAIAAWRTGRR